MQLSQDTLNGDLITEQKKEQNMWRPKRLFSGSRPLKGDEVEGVVSVGVWGARSSFTDFWPSTAVSFGCCLGVWAAWQLHARFRVLRRLVGVLRCLAIQRGHFWPLWAGWNRFDGRVKPLVCCSYLQCFDGVGLL